VVAGSFATGERRLLAIARAGRGLGGLRRRIAMSAGGECQDSEEEEEFGDVFHIGIDWRIEVMGELNGLVR
jgi:hypothetical protein